MPKSSNNKSHSELFLKWRDFVSSPATPRLAIAVSCYLLLFLITLNYLLNPGSGTPKVGDVAHRDYIAMRSTEFVDTDRTDLAREAAMNAVETAYSIDNFTNYEMSQDLLAFFNLIEAGRTDLDENITAYNAWHLENQRLEGEIPEDVEGLDAQELISPSPEPQHPDVFRQNLVDELLSHLNDYARIPTYSYDEAVEEDIGNLLDLDETSRDGLITLIDRAIRGENSSEIHDNPSNIELVVRNLYSSIETLSEEADISSDLIRLAQTISIYFIGPNVFENPGATEELRIAARDATEEIMGNVREGEIYLRAGEVVRQEDVDIMEALGINVDTGKKQSFAVIIFFALLLGTAFVLGSIYLGPSTFQRFFDMRYYLLFFTILIITYLASFFLIERLSVYALGDQTRIFVTLASLPIVAGAVLLAHYFTRMLALTVSAFLAVVLTVAAGEPAILIPALFTSLAASLVIKRDCPKPQMIRAIIILPVIWTLSLMAMAYSSGYELSALQANWWMLLGSIAPAPLAMILANYVLDAAFNIPTASRLQEFDNQDHPLLKKMQLDAPGTWHHSMMVGLIAEAACQAVGGNQHLVRVACMYHDIGKTRRPEFFIENQRGGSNIHDKYSPWLSKIIVESHVKDGIIFAKKHGLPQELIDTIPQHHGTSLITYFFRKALAMSDDGFVNEYDYRYPGPKPQTLEAACINIADASESAVRSLEEPTPHRIESLVNKIYEARLLDGQFEECGLALNQLEAIKDVIIDRLIGAYHARIDYPEEEELKRQLQLKRAESDRSSKSEPLPSDEE